jgi:carbon-monoxide dehydrogenase small subunit
VLLNREPVKSCQLLAVQGDGGSVSTIEGLAKDGHLHPIQEEYCEKHAVQCGFCTPGMILCAWALLQKNPHPNQDEVRLALYGNLCRCTGYQNIIEAIQQAGEWMAGAGETR